MTRSAAPSWRPCRIVANASAGADERHASKRGATDWRSARKIGALPSPASRELDTSPRAYAGEKAANERRERVEEG